MKPEFPPKAEFEERSRVLGKAIFEAIDLPVRRSEPAPDSILVEIASVVPKSGKTTQCQLLSSSLRAAMGSGLSVQVLPEPWEHPAMRALKRGEPDALLGRYMSEVLANYIDYMQSRVFHVGILDRSIVDLLIQEDVFMRIGKITREHRDSVWASLLSAPWAKRHAATFYLFTDIDTALSRESDGVSLSRTGTVMNRKYLETFVEAANSTIEALKTLAPQISVFPVDTTERSREETNAYITLTLLEHLKKKLNIDKRHTVPYSLSLMRSEVAESGKLQVQLKLSGNLSEKMIEKAGWKHIETSRQVDSYLIFAGGVHPEIAAGEIIRVREVEGKYYFAFKGVGSENTVTHRPHINIPIDERQAEELFSLYAKLAVVTKNPRIRYSKEIDPAVGVGGKIHLCEDSVEELGEFVELSLYSHNPEATRQTLFEEAHKLGFGLPDIVPGNYLRMMLRKKA